MCIHKGGGNKKVNKWENNGCVLYLVIGYGNAHVLRHTHTNTHKCTRIRLFVILYFVICGIHAHAVQYMYCMYGVKAHTYS